MYTLVSQLLSIIITNLIGQMLITRCRTSAVSLTERFFLITLQTSVLSIL